MASGDLVLNSKFKQESSKHLETEFNGFTIVSGVLTDNLLFHSLSHKRVAILSGITDQLAGYEYLSIEFYYLLKSQSGFWWHFFKIPIHSCSFIHSYGPRLPYKVTLGGFLSPLK